MQIKDAKFVQSNTQWQDCPKTDLPEYAFIGRSNVGKSSLINMLVNRNGLAKTSSTPGKTKLINHFFINDNWYLADLPGYGYAKVSKTERAKFSTLITEYILHRENLTNLFLLIDGRHLPLKNDLEFIQWLGEEMIPFSIVFTKVDKVSQKDFNYNFKKYRQELAQFWEELPPMFITSSEQKIGRDEILSYIQDINKKLNYK